ncbi:MAG: DeoR/GlpR transcriptional regulator, partial [Lachnospiraceae bacterium]|nr:DeoR/GlpR transcriptional regulator [Lachnospiraceae bacterium]
MKARQVDILRIVNEKQKVEVTELAEALSVSGVTIRKDLDMMEEKGLLRREHGYACAVSSDDINNRLAYNYEVKARIARAAADIVEDGETVMIESGSSCAMLAEILANERRDVNIITNS